MAKRARDSLLKKKLAWMRDRAEDFGIEAPRRLVLFGVLIAGVTSSRVRGLGREIPSRRRPTVGMSIPRKVAQAIGKTPSMICCWIGAYVRRRLE